MTLTVEVYVGDKPKDQPERNVRLLLPLRNEGTSLDVEHTKKRYSDPLSNDPFIKIVFRTNSTENREKVLRTDMLILSETENRFLVDWRDFKFFVQNLLDRNVPVFASAFDFPELDFGKKKGNTSTTTTFEPKVTLHKIQSSFDFEFSFEWDFDTYLNDLKSRLHFINTDVTHSTSDASRVDAQAKLNDIEDECRRFDITDSGVRVRISEIHERLAGAKT